MSQLTCDEAKARWGSRIYSGGPVTTMREIIDADGRWIPLYDSGLDWIGYRLVPVVPIIGIAEA